MNSTAQKYCMYSVLYNSRLALSLKVMSSLRHFTINSTVCIPKPKVYLSRSVFSQRSLNSLSKLFNTHTPNMLTQLHINNNRFQFSFHCQFLKSQKQHLSTSNHGILFSKSHEYVNMQDDQIAIIGISDYAQEKLGDVVYVELPEVGCIVSKEDTIATVESVKAASDIYAPVSGTVVDVNTKLVDEGGLINKSPLDLGWIVKIKLNKPDELKNFMTAETYSDFIEGEDENH